MRIALDAMGGDHAPEPNVEGAKAALEADKSLEIDDICNPLRISRSTFYRYVRL